MSEMRRLSGLPERSDARPHTRINAVESDALAAASNGDLTATVLSAGYVRCQSETVAINDENIAADGQSCVCFGNYWPGAEARIVYDPLSGINAPCAADPSRCQMVGEAK